MTAADDGDMVLAQFETPEAVAAELAVRAMDPKVLGDINNREQVVLIPDGSGSMSVLNLEPYRTAPARIGAARVATDPATFLRYINRYLPLDEQESARPSLEVWANSLASSFHAQLDSHLPGQPSRETHSIGLTLRHTPEWLAWLNPDTNGKLLKQVAFSAFIEDRAPDFIDPDAASMLELAQHFKADIKTSVKSTQRLADGSVQMAYVEEVNAKAGKTGDIKIPEEFTIAIRPYVDGAKYKLTVRLRYRLTDGQLSLGYSVANPEVTLERAFDDVRNILMLGVVEQRSGGAEQVVVPGLGVPIWNGARN